MEEQIISLPHGGDWAGFAAECGALPLDFSASVSPLGLPEGVRDAAAQALREADRYPDPLCRALRRAIAADAGRRISSGVQFGRGGPGGRWCLRPPFLNTKARCARRVVW